MSLQPEAALPGLIKLSPRAEDIFELEANAVAHALVNSWDQHEMSSLVIDAKPDQRLPAVLRRFFERELGYDLGAVRIHTGHDAALAAHRVGASAFTIASDVFFAAGRYRPDTLAGFRLLAHELVHVVQQGSVPRRSRPKVAVRCRARRAIQRHPAPGNLAKWLCPPGTRAKSIRSDAILGTLVGQKLGEKYLEERKPNPYGIYDHWVRWRGALRDSRLSDLWFYDRGVARALMSAERREVDWVRIALQRPDILDAETCDIYEIKPVRQAEIGRVELKYYLDELNEHAVEDPFVKVPFAPRQRKWRGGTTWDPSKYREFAPGAGRSTLCIVQPWLDPVTPGLVLYDVLVCEPERNEEAEASLGLAAVRVKEIVPALAPFRPEFEIAIEDRLPTAPEGSVYAFLVTPRVFETFVRGPRNELREQLPESHPLTRLFGKLMHDWIAAALKLTALSHEPRFLVPSPAWMDRDPMRQLLHMTRPEFTAEEKAWGAVAVAGTVLVVAGVFFVGQALVALELGGVVTAVTLDAAVVIPEAPLVPALVALETATVPVAVGTGLTAMSGVPPAWMIASAGGGASVMKGLGGVGAFLLVVVAADAQAASSEVPLDAKGHMILTEPLTLMSVESLVPTGDKIELMSEVLLGDEKRYVVGFAKAEREP